MLANLLWAPYVSAGSLLRSYARDESEVRLRLKPGPGHSSAWIPLEKRMTSADDIATIVPFLLAARAAHLTGRHVFVNCGYVHLDRALP
jgi:enoyl-[acyl-carrier-protein] reductase (NADH)